MSTSKEALRAFYDSLHGMTHAELADELRRPTMLHDWTREAVVTEALARLLELQPRVVAGEQGGHAESHGIVAFAAGYTEQALAEAVEREGEYTPSEVELHHIFRASDERPLPPLGEQVDRFAASHGFEVVWNRNLFPAIITFKRKGL